MGRVRTIVLGAAICSLLMAAPTMAMVNNPGFESGFTGWTNCGSNVSTHISTATKYSGAQSLEVRQTAAGGQGGMYQQIPVVNGAQYTITVQCFLNASANSRGTLRVNANGSTTMPTSGGVTKTTLSSWSLLSLTVTASSNHITIFLLDTSTAGSVRYAWFDDVTVDGPPACTPPAVPTNGTATVDSSSQITWGWNTASGADSYNGYSASSGGSAIWSASTNSKVESGLNANTLYTRYVASVGDCESTSRLALPAKYTLANVPGAPVVDGATGSTLDVNPAAMTPAGTLLAITIGGGAYTAGTHYVKADGTISTAAVWQTDAAWGTKTVVGLTGDTAYAFKVKAKNGDNVETAFSDETSESTTSDCTDVSILIQPDDEVVCSPATATFSVVAAGTDPVYQWQVSTDDGESWSDVTDGTGGASASYTTPATTPAMDGYKYRCVLSNCTSGSATTNAVTLTAGYAPAAPAEVSASPSAVCGALTAVTLSAEVEEGEEVEWFTGSCGGTLVGTGSSLVVNPTVTTTYYARSKHVAAGCNGDCADPVTVTVTGVALNGNLNSYSGTNFTNWTLYKVEGNIETTLGTYFNGDQPLTLPDGSTLTWIGTPNFYSIDPSDRMHLRLFMFTEVEEGGVYQVIPTTPGMSYTVSTWGVARRHQTENWTDVSGKLGVDLSGATMPGENTVWSAAVVPNAADNTPWAQRSVTVTATGSSITVFLHARNNVTSRATMFYDDVEVTCCTPPDAPANTSATADSASQITWAWELSDGATDYVIYDAATGGTGTSVGNVDSVIETDLDPNTQYQRWVSAADQCESLRTALPARYTLAEVPGAPTLGGSSTDSITVDPDPANNPEGTLLAIQVGSDYVQADGTLGSEPVWQTDADWGTKTVTGLTNDTEYCMQVKAKNGDDVETSLGDQACRTTLDCNEALITEQPTSADVCDGGSASFTVVAVGDGLSYQWQKLNGETWEDVSEATADTLSFSELSDADAGSYRCVVSSTCHASTATSNVVTLAVDTPVAPTEGIHGAGNTSITWSWSAPANATSYNLYDDELNLIADGLTGNTYEETGLAVDTVYTRYVEAVSACGVSPQTQLTGSTMDGSCAENAGFEVFSDSDDATPADGWTAFIEAGTSLTFPSSSSASSGSSSQQISCSDKLQIGYVWQKVNLLANYNYQLSASYRVSAQQNRAMMQVDVTGDDPNMVWSDALNKFVLAGAHDEWQILEYTGFYQRTGKTFSRSTDGPATIMVGYASGNNVTSKTGWVDDVKLSPGVQYSSPVAVTICSGSESPSFSITAVTDPNATYQWQHGYLGDAEYTDIEGANSASYSPGVLTYDSETTNVHLFRCVVTGGCGGSFTTPRSEITVDGDSDNDGVCDLSDVCPNTPEETPVDANGCSDAQNEANVAPTVTAWESVKTHTGVGEIALPLWAGRVEPRTGNLKIRVTFSHEMQVEAVPADFVSLVDSADAPVAIASVSMTATTLEVTVAQADANMKQLTLSLNNGANKLTRADAPNVELEDASLTIRCLIGDVTGDEGNGNGVVTITDMAKVRDNIGAVIDVNTCVYDVNLTGSITIADMAMVKLNIGNECE